jgi:NADP-dependent alcohol dehydrogenase
MHNFTFKNPVKIVFGKDTIAELSKLIPSGMKVMITYGGGSIMKNGVYDQVCDALKGYDLVMFGGIEPNPQYETLMKAVWKAREEKIDFLLSVGGGSVLDGTKFIAAAIPNYDGSEWDIVAESLPITEAVPLASVLTLPATGSEMNAAAVISREETGEKLAFIHPQVYPQFSILDPETTFSLPPRQTANGVVDAFVHTAEQYFTYPSNAPLQDRWCESIFQTLIEEGPKVMTSPSDYEARANIMWAACMALNGIIGVGIPQDWATHMIGHELTALYGYDHAQTLAIVLPGILDYKREAKGAKIIQYGERVWGITDGTDEERIDAAISKTSKFFASLGLKSSLTELGADMSKLPSVGTQIDKHGMELGENGDIRGKEAMEILAGCK